MDPIIQSNNITLSSSSIKWLHKYFMHDWVCNYTHTHIHVLWGKCHSWIDDSTKANKKSSREKRKKREQEPLAASINKTDTSHAPSHCTITRWIFYGMKLYMIQRDEFYELCWLQFIVFIHFVPLVSWCWRWWQWGQQ